MLGINDPGIILGYLLTIVGLIACVMYGALNWNKGMETNTDDIQRDLDWEEKDEHLKEEI